MVLKIFRRGINSLIFWSYLINTSANVINFIWGDRIAGAEAQVNIPINYPIRVTRFDINVQANTKDGVTLMGFRDDAVSVVSVSVGAGLVGLFSSGVINVGIAEGSLIDHFFDTTASTLGNIVSGLRKSDVDR